MPDPDAVTPFYEKLFGWKRERAMDMGEAGPYWLFKLGDENVAGMMRQPPETPVPNWLPYIGVDDTDAATGRARELGATVTVQPQDVPGTGRFSAIVDPTGAAVALLTAEPM